MKTIFKNITTIATVSVLTALIATSASAQQVGVKKASDRAYTQPVQPLPALRTNATPSHQPSHHVPVQPQPIVGNGFNPFGGKMDITTGAGFNGATAGNIQGTGFINIHELGGSNTNVNLGIAGEDCTVRCLGVNFAGTATANHSNSIEAVSLMGDMSSFNVNSPNLNNGQGGQGFSNATNIQGLSQSMATLSASFGNLPAPVVVNPVDTGNNP